MPPPLSCAWKILGELHATRGANAALEIQLARTLNNLGLVRRNEFPTIPDFQSAVGATLHNLAEQALERSDLDTALERVEEAIEHQRAALLVRDRDPTFRFQLRNHYWALGDIRVRQKRHVEAVEAAKQLAEYGPSRSRDCPIAASIMARCAGLASRDPSLRRTRRDQLADSYAVLAVQTLDERTRMDTRTTAAANRRRISVLCDCAPTSRISSRR